MKCLKVYYPNGEDVLFLVGGEILHIGALRTVIDIVPMDYGGVTYFDVHFEDAVLSICGFSCEYFRTLEPESEGDKNGN